MGPWSRAPTGSVSRSPTLIFPAIMFDVLPGLVFASCAKVTPKRAARLRDGTLIACLQREREVVAHVDLAGEDVRRRARVGGGELCERHAEALGDLVRRIARGDHVARYGNARDCRGHWNGRRAS